MSTHNYRNRQAGDARDTAADITLARHAPAFGPSCDLLTGLAAQLECQREDSVAWPAAAPLTAHG